MDQSPRLSLSYLMPAQAQKHVTVNETFRRLDQLVQSTVLSRTVAAEPSAPNDGDAYILPASPTGTAWATFAQNNIAAYQDGAWTQIIVAEGFSAWVSDADEFTIYDGAAWNQISGSGGETAAKFGVNTTADTTNKLTVKSNAVLFDALDVAESGTGDSQVKVNKEAVGDTASHLFQTAFSGRAEFGLTGDDDFHIKVSADGALWFDAITVDKDNGKIAINGLPGGFRLMIKGGNGDQFALDNAGERFTQFNINNNGNGRVFVALDETLNRFIFAGQGSYTAFDAIAFRPDGSNDDMQIKRDGSVIVGNPTGGGKGVGTLNAVGVYDDNTLLTCYVFDQVLDGAIDDKKWDEKVPDRTIPEAEDSSTGEITPEKVERRNHAPMRKFRARIGTVEDPLTLDGYAKHWREKRHLTSMPNEAAFDPAKGLSSGEWVQRLVETVEIQAVLIEELNQRVKVLETTKLKR